MMVRRLSSRVAFGSEIARQTVWQERIAESRCMIEQARLLVLKAAWLMDTSGNKVARKEIAMIKVVAPNVACKVIDWAIQAYGGRRASTTISSPAPTRARAACGSPTVPTKSIATRSPRWSCAKPMQPQRMTSFDYVIVGAGSAGCVLARGSRKIRA
jgi:hypothetical protein